MLPPFPSSRPSSAPGEDYRSRVVLEKSEAKYDGISARLAKFPNISVPSNSRESTGNRSQYSDFNAYPSRFFGKYKLELLSNGVAPNMPQDEPCVR